MSAEMPIVNQFGAAVKATERIILPHLQAQDPEIRQLHYEHGDPAEIIDTLVNMNNPQEFQFLKYPLVALFQPFAETKGRRPGELKKVRLTVVIATQGVRDAKAADRYVTSFTNILYPIYEQLIGELRMSPMFQGISTPAHDKTDRPYWGKEGLYGNIANKATDILDCIEIRNLELLIREPYCSVPGLTTQQSTI